MSSESDDGHDEAESGNRIELTCWDDSQRSFGN